MQHTNTFAGFNTSAKIEIGKKACFSLIDLDSLQYDSFQQYPAFYYLNENNMHTVIANGKFIKQNNSWWVHDMQGLQHKVSGIVKRLL